MDAPSDARIGKAVVLGASGGVGRAVVAELGRRGVAARVVSRSRDRLQRDFGSGAGPDGGPAPEILGADLTDPAAAREAVEGADAVFHCVGLALERFDQHVSIARGLAEALGGRRCVVASSYWSFAPIGECPYDETHPREPISRYGRVRRDQEDLLAGAGACVACLPDFIGPEAELTVINHPVQVAARGRRAMFPGDPRAARDFITMADAGRVLVELALAEGSGGRIVPVNGSGPVEPRGLAAMGAEVTGARAGRVRGASPAMLLVASLTSRQAHLFRDLLPIYRAPAWSEGRLLGELIGDGQREGYASIVRRLVEAGGTDG